MNRTLQRLNKIKVEVNIGFISSESNRTRRMNILIICIKCIFLQKILFDMEYYKVTFEILPDTPTNREILSFIMGEAGFESFVDSDTCIEGYIQKNLYDKELIENSIEGFPICDVRIDFSATDAENKDWNYEWEQKGFKPIIIDDLCVIHSTMHKNLPKLKYDITINPKMSFGSGSHETTRQLTSIILNRNFSNKNVLDMGCGTFILGIASAIKGASHITGIDIDEFCTQNAEENCKLNNISNYTIIHGDASAINTSQKYNYIFANIHKNTIISDLDKYVSVLAENGHILLSGFYTEDADSIIKYAETLGLKVSSSFSENNWAVLELVRK